MRPALFRLWRDRRGATIVEFAMVAPVLMAVIIGILDIGHTAYTQSILQGAIQRAARSATIQGSATRTAQIDVMVTEAVNDIVLDPDITFDRKVYASFSDVGQAEDYTDLNDDGVCNDGEAFEDANRNGSWDSDRGAAGSGGARDAVLYTVRVSYPRLFPTAALLGLPSVVTAEASTVLRNQPYDLQYNVPAVGNCS